MDTDPDTEYESEDIKSDELELEIYEDEYETIIETVDARVSKDLDYYDTFEIEDFSWNAECIKLFLNLYRERIHLFRNPKVKKKLIWKQIQDIFQNLGYSIGFLALTGKFRNLKHMFKKINSRINENENYPNKWPYYKAMAEILDENAQIDEDSKAIFVSEKFDEPKINLFDWTDDNIMLLLTSYKDRKLAKFRKNTKPIWKEIKEIFWSHGIKCTAEQLHKKYRLLHGNFHTIQEKQKRLGQYESTWRYFKVFEEITAVPDQELIDKSIAENKAAEAAEEIGKLIWTEHMIKLLITLYNDKKHKFQNPLIMNGRLWKQMQTDFSINGYDVTGEMLYDKFRSLKSTYQKIIRRHRETDNIYTRWPYYNLMKDVFTNHDPISFNSEYVDDVEENHDDEDQEDNVDDEDEEPKHSASGCYHWSIKAVKILLMDYKKRIAQFADKNVKKKDLWKEIKDHLAKNGYDIEQTIIEKKFRTLKHRYLRICNLKQQKSCRWNFFQLMASIMNPDGTLKLNDNKIKFDDLTKTSDAEPFPWTPEKIYLLLNNYYERKDSFFNPKTNIRNLWHEIVEDFLRKGYNVNEDIISEKYRQLRNNFVRRRNKRDSSGQRIRKWEYYDIMAKIYEKNIDSDENNMTVKTQDENEVTDNRPFIWTYESTNLLINCYIDNKDEFLDPHVRNTALWNEMAKIFLSKNYKVTPTMLSKKFRVLKRTYTRNKFKLSDGEITSSKWLFFNSMHKIFGDDQMISKDCIENKDDHDEDQDENENENEDEDEDENENENENEDEDDYGFSDFQFIGTENYADTSDIVSQKKEIETKLSITPAQPFSPDDSDAKINKLLKFSENSNERLNSLENRLITIETLLNKNNELQIANNSMLKKYLTALHDRL